MYIKRALTLILTLSLLLTPLAFAENDARRLEFEEGELLGEAQVNQYWVDNLKKEGDGVSVTFDAPESREYDLYVIQASLTGRMSNDLLLDGQKIATVIAEGSEFAPFEVTNVYMEAGRHVLSVMRSYGWVRLDALEIKPTPVLNRGVYEVSSALSNPEASEQAQELYKWICESYGSKIISGQYMDEGRYGRELDAIHEVTGKYPALVGLDMMNYSPSSVSLGSYPVSVDQALEYWRQGYIITFCWHWVAPEKYLNTSGNAWWGGFNTDKTTFDLKKALNGEDEEGYKYLLRDMEAIAGQLTILRDAGVPVIWRPLHEASGGWFWWGASGSEAYIELYRLMYDKFTNEYGLNNLIWLWNGQSARWYPGDDVVDIIGEDIYAGNHAHESQTNAFIRCLSYTSAKKPIFLSECGCVPSPIACERDETMWGAWCTWCYEFVLNDDGSYSENYTSADTLKMFYDCENVITLSDVPAFGRELASEEVAADAGVIRLEFEDGELLGCAKIAGMGSQKYADVSGNDEGDGVKLTFSVPASDYYDISVLQAGIGGYKENFLFIDGEKQENNLTVQGTDWEESYWGSAWLEEGEHEIEINAFWGWVKLDALTLTPR